MLAVLALAPAMVMAVALATGDLPVWGRVERVWQSQGLVLVLAASVAIVSAAGFTPGRLSRRRLSWLLVWSALLLAAVSVARVDLDPRSVAVVMTLGLWGLAGLVVRLATATDLRPLDEPLVDVAAAVLTLVIGAGVGVLVGVAATRAGIPAPELRRRSPR